MNIRSGRIEELKQPVGDWCFVDLGFASKAKSCGYLFASFSEDTKQGPEEITYGELVSTLTSLVSKKAPPLHLVLEAPISSAFSQEGNPTGRSIEKTDAGHRYWFVPVGCLVLVSALYLVKRLSEANPQREIRIFEGFVSFKKGGKSSTSHIKDVEAMQHVVWSQGKDGGYFCEPKALHNPNESSIQSTLALLGMDATPPAIVRVEVSS